MPDPARRAIHVADRSPLRVVLCEDDRDARRWILAALGRSGCDVVGLADTGASALRLADGAQPDLLVIDLALLGSPGFRYAHLLRARTPRTAMIVISPLGNLEAAVDNPDVVGVVGTSDVAAFRRALAAVRVSRRPPHPPDGHRREDASSCACCSGVTSGSRKTNAPSL